jgi:lipopolysaccharide transport system permease protein
MISAKPLKVFTAKPLTIGEYLLRLIKYRGLIWVFAYQEIKSLYAQTYLGLIWIILRPLMILAIFTVLFNYLLNIQTTAPYYLFAFSGMIAWNFFQQIAMTASYAIIEKQQLIRKMYFPKLILPLSKVIVAGVEALVSLLIIFAMMRYADFPLTTHILAFPLFILLNICAGLAIAFWMNALTVRYRDLNQIVMPIISIAIWFTPVFFPTTLIPPQYHWLIFVNPMAGIIEGFRFALLGQPFPDPRYFISIGLLLIFMLAGIRYLSVIEDEIVDYV